MKRFLINLWSNKRAAWAAARILLLLFVAMAVLIMALEDRLIFFPTKYPDGQWSVNLPPLRDGEIAPHIEDRWMVTADGVKLHGWYCTPHQNRGGMIAPVPAQMALLWFHGNAGNITYRYEMMRMLMSIPVNVFIIDYRGYGKSEGAPSEQGIYLDAQAAWGHLVNVEGVSPDRIIIFGKSLGGAAAIDLAARVKPAGLIVQSSFTSIADMAAEIMPLFPGLLLRSKMDSINKVARVYCPKLFVHSPADEVVPYRLGRKLYEAAAQPKEFYEVEGAPHNETYLVGGRDYIEALRRFIQSCAPQKKRDA